MSGPSIIWNGKRIGFVPGDTIAIALSRAGISFFGTRPAAQPAAVFCGIGQCQNCLVTLPAKGVVEACLVPCQDGLDVRSLEENPDA